MAAIVKRGKTYSIVYTEGEGKDKHQVWESGMSYGAAKSRKAQLEYEFSQNIHVDRIDLTISDFLREFIEKYGEKKWGASTYDGNVGLIENYVIPTLEIRNCGASEPNQWTTIITFCSTSQSRW